MENQKDWVENERLFSQEDKSILNVLLTIVDNKLETANKILKDININKEFILLRRTPKRKTTNKLLTDY